MLRRSRVFIYFLCALIGWPGTFARADGPYRRLVNFEWDGDPDARTFEIEIQQSGKDGKTYKFKVKQALWNGKLTPGQYSIRLRALDARGVPGDWSEPAPFPVGLETPQLTFPKPRQLVSGNSATEAKVTLQWKPVPGAKTYQLEIASADGEVKKSAEATSATAEMKLPVAKVYKWKVGATGADGVASDTVAEGEFTLLGQKLAPPRIAAPENDFAREVTWQPTPDARKYDIVVARLNPNRKAWVKMHQVTDTDQTSVPIDQSWPGGSYTVMVKAKGDLRSPSEFAKQPFQLRGGDRSPAAEFAAEVKKSIDRINGWYGIASYLITQIDYAAQDFDPVNPLGIAYSAVGGTGRIGVGYFKENKVWGFLSIVDLSGFLNENSQNLTYSSAEISGVYRKSLGDRSEFRAQVGGFYKEQQVARGQYLGVTNSRVKEYVKGTVAGPHVGAEYWFSFSPKFGVQANAHLYYSMIGLSVPNGQSVIPSLSNQFGFLGSYRFNRRFTGLVGYTRREDRLDYKSAPTDPQYEGQKNTSVLTGNYLNFFAEYAF